MEFRILEFGFGEFRKIQLAQIDDVCAKDFGNSASDSATQPVGSVISRLLHDSNASDSNASDLFISAYVHTHLPSTWLAFKLKDRSASLQGTPIHALLLVADIAHPSNRSAAVRTTRNNRFQSNTIERIETGP